MKVGRSADDVNVLLVGFGVRGRQWRSALRGARGLQLAAIVDPDPGVRDLAETGRVQAFPSLEEALEEGRADAAIVCSPPGLHVEQAVACLDAGLGVLVEKPLALSVSSAGRVVERARATGRPALVAQNFRFLPRERTARELLGGDRIGRPLSGVVVSARPIDAARPHLRAVELGPLWDICLHHLDALRTRVGTMPATVRAELAQPCPGRQVYSLVLEWPRGPRIAYQHSEGAPVYHYSEWFEAEEGAIAIRNDSVSLVLPGHRPRRVASGRAALPERALLGSLARALEGEEQPAMTAEENLGTIAIVEAVARSIALAQPVYLGDEEAAPTRPRELADV